MNIWVQKIVAIFILAGILNTSSCSALPTTNLSYIEMTPDQQITTSVSPKPVSNAPELNSEVFAFGNDISYLIADNNSLFIWGFNKYGALGNDSLNSSATPVKALDEVESVSGTCSITFAILKDGSLWAWGEGLLGNGAYDGSLKPVKIMDGVKAVSTNEYSTFVIKEDNTLWAWGSQLGNGSDTSSLLPVKIMDNVKMVKTVYNLGQYTLALKLDGSLWAWGDNIYGRLGDGTTQDRLSPVKILDDVCTIANGFIPNFAIKDDGSLWAWGENSYGQVGNGTMDDCLEPTKVLDDVKSVMANVDYTLAIKRDGSLWSWGANYFTQLGDGTDEACLKPKKILDDVDKLAIGQNFSLALKQDKSLWTWGECDQENYNGVPIKILDDVKSIAAGQFHSLAVKYDGSIWAWGSNCDGQLGDGTTEDRILPVQVLTTDIINKIESDIVNEIEYLVVPDYNKYLLCQFDYPAFINENGVNVGCSATAWAMGKSMLEKTIINPENYWGSNGCNWSGYKEERSIHDYAELELFKFAYEQILEGKPTVLCVENAPISTWHYVTIVGVRKGADKNNLSRNDILVADPGYTLNATTKEHYANPITTYAEAIERAQNIRGNNKFSPLSIRSYK